MDENAFQLGWFLRSELDGVESFAPLPLAKSMWSDDQMHGVAVSGLLARTLERHLRELGRSDLVPARFRVDLFCPARMAPTSTRATVVREGSRIVLIDAVVEQEGSIVARASGTFLQPTDGPQAEVWSVQHDQPVPPPSELLPALGEHHVPLFASAQPWSNNFTEHQNPGRHQTWQTAMPIVVDEPCTPFEAVASIADATSLVTNWGANGVEFINADVDLALSRLPEDTCVGLRAVNHVSSDGVAAGTAEVFDRAGVLGTATVTCLANRKRTVDFSGSEWDGSRDHPGA